MKTSSQEEFQKGYAHHDSVVRHSMVKSSKLVEKQLYFRIIKSDKKQEEKIMGKNNRY